MLREIAKHKVASIEEFHKLEIQGLYPEGTLHVREIKTIKNKTEIVYDIGA